MLALLVTLVSSKFNLDVWVLSYGQISQVSLSNGQDLFCVIVKCLGLCLVSGIHELEVFT